MKILSDSLIKNSIYLIITNLFNLILGFFFWVLAARYYSPDEVGITSALLSGMFLISMISSLGFPTALIYYLPRNERNESKIINSCLTASTLASIIFSLIFIFGLNIWSPSLKAVLDNIKFVSIFIGVSAVSIISFLISSAFIAGKKSSFHMTKEGFFGFVKIVPLFYFTGLGALGIFVSWGIGLVLAIVLGFILLPIVWKEYYPKPLLDRIILGMAEFSAANYFARVFDSLPRLVLPIMIVNLISAESTGFFFIALTVANLLYGIPQSISNSLLAESSNLEEIWGKVGKAVRFNLALLFLGLLLFVLFGEFVLNLFNPVYAENASTTLLILALTSLPLSLNTIYSAVRNAQKRVRSVAKINATVAVITLAFSIPLIKISGIEGAAISYLVGNTITAIAVVYRMRTSLGFVSNLILTDKT